MLLVHEVGRCDLLTSVFLKPSSYFSWILFFYISFSGGDLYSAIITESTSQGACGQKSFASLKLNPSLRCTFFISSGTQKTTSTL